MQRNGKLVKDKATEARIQSAVADVWTEIDRARAKWPQWPDDIVHAAALVAEESGELTKAVNEYTYEGGTLDAIRTEAIHTAATAIRLLANLR